MSQLSCVDIGVRSEYTRERKKLWRCRSMRKGCTRVQGRMSVRVMSQIGMRERGGSVCVGMAGRRVRA